MWLMLACQPDPSPAPPSDTSTISSSETAEPAPEVVVEIPAPVLSAEGVAAAIESVFVSGMPSPLLPRRIYLESFAGRDSSCPGGKGYNLPGAFQGCVAESGWLYAGVAEYDGSVDPDDLRDFSLLADCYMIDPDGNWFVAAGELLLEHSGDENGGMLHAELSGTYSFAPAGGWMAPAGAGAVLSQSAAWDHTGWQLAIDGVVTDGTTSVRLEDLSVSSGECAGVPSGVYGLRGDGGYWYTLAGEDCGCGMVTWADGSQLGEACVDLSAASAGLIEAVRQ
ncbi:MAG: hypothetical protein P8R54_11105 [Myxococcota bacterium]|nr:hypothetical protein [Myxococcota bacterium]